MLKEAPAVKPLAVRPRLVRPLVEMLPAAPASAVRPPAEKQPAETSMAVAMSVAQAAPVTVARAQAGLAPVDPAAQRPLVVQPQGLEAMVAPVVVASMPFPARLPQATVEMPKLMPKSSKLIRLQTRTAAMAATRPPARPRVAKRVRLALAAPARVHRPGTRPRTAVPAPVRTALAELERVARLARQPVIRPGAPRLAAPPAQETPPVESQLAETPPTAAKPTAAMQPAAMSQ